MCNSMGWGLLRNWEVYIFGAGYMQKHCIFLGLFFLYRWYAAMIMYYSLEGKGSDLWIS